MRDRETWFSEGPDQISLNTGAGKKQEGEGGIFDILMKVWEAYSR